MLPESKDADNAVSRSVLRISRPESKPVASSAGEQLAPVGLPTLSPTNLLTSTLLKSTSAQADLEQQLIEQLRARLGDGPFRTWFTDRVVLRCTTDDVTLQCENPFLLQWIQRAYRRDLGVVAGMVLGPHARVVYETPANGEHPALPVPEPERVPLDLGDASTSVTTPRGDSRDGVPTVVPTASVPAQPAPTKSTTRSDRFEPQAAAELFPQAMRSVRARPQAAAPATPRPSAHSAPPVTSPTLVVPVTPTPVKAVGKVSSLSRRHEAAGGVGAVAATAATPSAGGSPRGGRRFADLADFVPCEANDLVLTAVRHVCQQPGVTYPILHLYGNIGVGKTHLLEGIYKQCKRAHPESQVLYQTAESFTNLFTQALRERSMPGFRARFRAVDVLLVDDIDFFDGKRGVQEEFLHTLRQLEQSGRQVVVSANVHPRLLAKTSEELRSRLLSGMVCRIEMPDVEARFEIVKRRAQKLAGEFSPEALHYVAERFRGSVRELEGALHYLHNYHLTTSKKVTLSEARQILRALEQDCLRVVRMADIERVICSLFGIDGQCLKSPSRSRSASQPRTLAMYLARRHTKAACSEIGAYFGGRNHSTVIAADQKAREWLDREAQVDVLQQPWRVADALQWLEQQLQVG